MLYYTNVLYDHMYVSCGSLNGNEADVTCCRVYLNLFIVSIKRETVSARARVPLPLIYNV